MMSYARWTNSNWYAFWSCVGGETRDEQVLSLWLAGKPYGSGWEETDWTYAALADMDAAALHDAYEGALDADIAEALDIIAAFRADVEHEYGTN